jgi:hypothetical protein
MDVRVSPSSAAEFGAALAAAGHATPGQRALMQACRAVLRPLARLAVSRGLPFANLAELLKQSYVEEALAAHPGVPPHRAVSRISATTGLNRREVTRLMQRQAGEEAPARPSPATQVFTRWLSEPQLQAENGQPVSLPVQGPAPSFESLAQSVTRDVHPRTLLEELARLGLARIDTAEGRVHLLRSAFVPRADLERMLAFLGANVGDHLCAAVDNVLTDGTRHFEQALFADELSEDSLAEVREMVSAEWQRLLHTLAPALQSLIDADRAAGRPADQRMRIGLFAFTDAMPPAGDAPPSPVSTPKEI